MRVSATATAAARDQVQQAAHGLGGRYLSGTSRQTAGSQQRGGLLRAVCRVAAQTPEGAELCALLFWLRHLDAATPLRPVFTTDARRVVDGWSGLWGVLGPWVPRRGWWAQALWLKQDRRQDVLVQWRPRGSAGNAAADRLAKAAVARAAGEVGHAAAVARTATFASRLCRYYGRLLDMALDGQRLPMPDAFGRLFRLPRPPPLPLHAVATDAAGLDRCTCCCLPTALLGARPCRPAGILGHRLLSVGGGLACLRCGAYAFRKILHLGQACRGRPADGAASWRRRRLLAGQHPVTAAALGPARPIDAFADMVVVLQ